MLALEFMTIRLRPCTLGVLILLGGLAGCESDDSASTKTEANIHCVAAQGELCIEGPATSGIGAFGRSLRDDCTEIEGTLQTGACPLKNHVASCVYRIDNQLVKARYYSPITKADVQIGCAGGRGVFQEAY